MRVYEGIFVFSPDAAAESAQKQEKILDEMIPKYGGTIIQKTDLGKKNLGYLVRKFREGRFLVYDFKMDPSRIDEFQKGLNLQDDVLKHMILVKEGKSAPAPKTAEPAKNGKEPVSSGTHS